jgi:hypothetical protein
MQTLTRKRGLQILITGKVKCTIRTAIYLSMALQPFFFGPWPLFQFLNLFTQLIGLLGREISLSQGYYLYKQNKRTQTSMPQVGFESTIPVFDRAKKIHALDRAATVIGAIRKTTRREP